MKAEAIYKLAERFYFLTKRAGVLDNMAARVLYSTVPPGRDDLIALRSLIPGARELLHYGAQVIQHELIETQRIKGHDKPSLGPYGEPNLVTQLATLMNTDKTSYFQNAAELFESMTPGRSLFGGESWKKITLALRNLSVTMDQLAKNPNDIPTLKQMTVDMNLIDGLSHNTGLLMDKILDFEANDRGEYGLSERESKYNQLIEVMDAKEMGKPEDVMRVVAPIVEKSVPEVKLPFRDILTTYRSSVKHVPPEEPVDTQLKKVRMRKELMEARNAFARDLSDPVANITSIRWKLSHVVSVVDKVYPELANEFKALYEALPNKGMSSTFKKPVAAVDIYSLTMKGIDKIDAILEMP